MPICRCWQCGYEKAVDSLEEARRLARVHMGAAGCILVFGYTDAKYREALGLDETDEIIDSEMLSGEWRDELPMISMGARIRVAKAVGKEKEVV